MPIAVGLFIPRIHLCQDIFGDICRDPAVRTMDTMAAFGRSVNLIINLENVGEAGVIIECGIADNEAFYRPFKDALKRAGRL
ncbi:MAG: hypothetical protein JXB42_02260 [Deltaproteobacteria bacterium]|nr:hypothetical protein [Deltaproteobacteria bacterium]